MNIYRVNSIGQGCRTNVTQRERYDKNRSPVRFRCTSPGAGEAQIVEQFCMARPMRVTRGLGNMRREATTGDTSHLLDWTKTMVDRKWASRVTQAAASTTRDRLNAVVSQGAVLAKGADGVANGIPALIASNQGPTLPLRDNWALGLGQILSGLSDMPASLRGTIGHLDRLGRIQISPDAISFDGDTVRWDKVEEIRFGPALDMITSYALQHEATRLTSLLPPVPGRAWLVRQALGVLVALCLAVAGSDADTAETDESAADIPVLITNRGFARRKEMTPGVFAALVAANTPGFGEAVVQIAHERGIKLTTAPVTRSRTQALAMRKMADAALVWIGRQGELPAGDGLSDEWAD
jgi:hypothetical protein